VQLIYSLPGFRGYKNNFDLYLNKYYIPITHFFLYNIYIKLINTLRLNIKYTQLNTNLLTSMLITE
jgi:hypothetical protein